MGTKAPTKLHIECLGPKKYKFTWNRKDNYNDQDIKFGYKTSVTKDGKTTKNTVTKSKDLGGSTTSYTYTIPDSVHFYPEEYKDKNGNKKRSNTKLTSVFFEIKAHAKGKNKGNSSTVKESLNIDPPTQPKAFTGESSQDNVSIFSWNPGTDKTSKTPACPYSTYEYQSVTKYNISSTKDEYFADLPGWSSSTFIKNPKQEGIKYTETLDESKSLTRAFRVRHCGPAGHSKWDYAHITYATAPRSTNPTIVDKPKTNDERQTIDVTVAFDATSTASHPIDNVYRMYCIGTPTASLGLPASPSWQQYGKPYKPVKGSNEARFEINTVLQDDQCLWVRFDTEYKEEKIYGTPILVLKGMLAAPTINNVSTSDIYHTINVTATNNSAVEDSFLAIVYKDSAPTDESDSGTIIAVIPHGRTTPIVDDIQAPDWTGKEPVGVEVYAVANAEESYDTREDNVRVYTITPKPKVVTKNGTFTNGKSSVSFFSECSRYGNSYDSILRGTTVQVYATGNVLLDPNDYTVGYYINQTSAGGSSTVTDCGVTITIKSSYSGAAIDKAKVRVVLDYSDALLESKVVSEGGDIPLAPTNLKLAQVENNGIIQATWKSLWDKANGTELSWSDHEDAWYSTSQPSTFDVSNIKQNKLNISDLSLGVKYYVRARSYKVNSEGNYIYSSYSEIESLSLASAPNIPYLELKPDPANISLEDSFTAQWVYVSTDTTKQATATLYEVEQTEDGNIYNEIASTMTAEHITLGPDDIADLGWLEDSTHLLSVTVTSESGETSGYSDPPVPLTIVRKPVATIQSISLVHESVLTNSHVYTGEVVDFSGGYEDPNEYDEDHRRLLASFRIIFDPFQSGGSYFKYKGIVATLNDVEYPVTWTVDDVYGGYFDIVSGILTVTHNSSGQPLATPKTYDLGKIDFDIKLGINRASSIVTIGEGGDFTYSNGTLTFPSSSYSNGSITVNNSLYEDGFISTSSYRVGKLRIVTVDDIFDGDVLKELPMTYDVRGFGNSGGAYIRIQREGDYPTDRPDERVSLGASGEVIFQDYIDKEEEHTITLNDLPGYLDDGATYLFIAVVAIKNGDTITQMSDPVERRFTVKWTEQAVMPEGIVEIDQEEGIAKITPVLPEGGRQTDHVDIYRLSGDKPELIYANATFGQVYVDPYPTIGKRGGYRLVYITKNGDYVDEDNTFTWLDITENAHLESKFQYIDFDGNQIEFKYNVSLSNKWNKSFTETKYLGGAIEGDWDVGTSRTIDISGNTFDDIEPEVYELIRDLGDFPGLCHVRTIDGSNFTANIEVSGDNSTYHSLEHQHDISMSITKVDNPEMDGMTLEEWQTATLEEES